MFDSLRPHEPSMPGLSVHHQLLEITKNHVHRVVDAIQPSHPLSSPSTPAPNASQNQGSLNLWQKRQCNSFKERIISLVNLAEAKLTSAIPIYQY